jgi:K(+)-stimulated pyrophosphate-energized sodium pump
VSGVLWAIFQNNAGGAWDNAKKSFEAGVEINGEMTYKGSDAHKAAVTGDTVGDPFKDTSGPSMNILIKLTCLIGLVIAPILGGHSEEGVAHADVQQAIFIADDGTKTVLTLAAKQDVAMDVDKRVEVKMTAAEGDDAKAVITTTTTENGEAVVKEEIIEGTIEEVKAKVNALENANAKAKDGAKEITIEVEEVKEGK